MIGAIFHIENRDDDFNELPSRREMSCEATYWNFVGSILAGVGGHREVENSRIAALRRNAADYERQRRPIVVEVVAAVAEAVRDKVAEAIGRVPIPGKAKAKTAKDAAIAWLVATLSGQLHGQLAAVAVEKLAKEAGISMRTLRRAAQAAGIKHVRNADKTWSWRLIRARPKAGGKV